MKQTALDVLIYLFDHLDDGRGQDFDHKRLKVDLFDAGFEVLPIEKALEWLEVLANQRNGLADYETPAAHSFRIFTPQESHRLGADCQGLLISLEQSGMLDARTREIIIERLLALDPDVVDLEQLKWVTLMVLFNQPDREENFFWIEELVNDDSFDVQH